MPSGLQALLALFLLLPGFVSARIADILNARSQQSDLQRIVQALIHSFVIYVLYIAIFGSVLPIEWVLVADARGSSHFAVQSHRWNICTLCLLSITLGAVWGFAKSLDWPMRWLRRWGWSERTLRESVWNDVMLTETGTVQVGLGDGRSVIGILSRYSDTGEEGSLFLSKASWVGEDNTLVPIPGAGLLLTKSADIKFIMFIEETAAKGVDSLGNAST